MKNQRFFNRKFVPAAQSLQVYMKGMVINMKRYKYKLNMLGPGSKMCAMIGIGIFLSIVLWMVRWHTAAYISGGITILLVIVLILLLVIEAHQDRVMYENAKKEDKDIK